MDHEQGNNQTTQGIWISVNKTYKTIIIDCEGTDSKERGENRLQFENCSSLFCLALSDVLLMNMWTQDVGRYTASNYNVLKMVFEMNLKLFNQDCAKKIIVILRDYNEKICKKEIFESLILKDIQNLWNEIKKPDKFADSKPSQFFSFEFVTLPHKVFQEELFDEEVGKLRERLDRNHKSYIFDHSTGAKNVPIESYVRFCLNIWDTIINEKDLNIPSQKEMLAIYRCNAVKEESYAIIKADLINLNDKSHKQKISKFKDTVLGIYQKCLNNYDKVAKDYVERIYNDIRNNLKLQLINELYTIFTNQINRILPISLKHFSKDLDDQLIKGSNFFKVVNLVKEDHLQKLKKNIMELKAFEEWEVSINEYEEQYDNAIDYVKKNCLEKLQKEIQESLKLQIEELIIEKIATKIEKNFWEDFNLQYIDLVYTKLFALNNTLTDYYKIEINQAISYVEEIEFNISKGTIKELEKRTKDISNFSIEYFKGIFNLDENKMPRKWNRLQEKQIEDLYTACKNETEILFSVFDKIKVVDAPIKKCK